MEPQKQNQQVLQSMYPPATPLSQEVHPPTLVSPQPAQPIQQPYDATQKTTTQPYNSSLVTVFKGITIFNGLMPGLLEWGADNRIRLYQLNEAGDQPIATLVDCAPQEIRKFSVSSGFKLQAILKAPNRTYYIDFGNSNGGKAAIAQTAGQALGLVSPLAGLIGLATSTAVTGGAAQQVQEKTMVWWKENLNRYGVHGADFSATNMFKLQKKIWIIFGIFMAAVVAFVLLSMIVLFATTRN